MFNLILEFVFKITFRLINKIDTLCMFLYGQCAYKIVKYLVSEPFKNWGFCKLDQKTPISEQDREFDSIPAKRTGAVSDV